MNQAHCLYGLYLTDEILERSNMSQNFILPLELMKNWEHCSVLSDFLAYNGALDSSFSESSRNVFSTIANELLENAVKYSFDQNKLVTLSVIFDDGDIVIETVNLTQEKNAEKLSEFVNLLQNSTDIETLFFEQLEKSFDSHAVSGLGFLGLLKDYNIQLGIKIASHFELDHTYDVFVKVRIPQALFSTCKN